MRKLGIGLTAALFIAAVAAPALATPRGTGDLPLENGHKVTICHATSSSNPVQYWEAITVDIASSNYLKRVQGHVGHTDPAYAKKDGRLDLIPEFTYNGDTYGGFTDPGNNEDWATWSDLNEEDAAACEGDPEDPETGG